MNQMRSEVFSSSGAQPADDHLALLRQSVSEFVARNCDGRRIREQRAKLPGYSRTVWSAMAEAGWLGIAFPEEYGGLGLGMAEMTEVARGLAESAVPEPFVAYSLAARVVADCGNEALKSKLLPAFASGETLPMLAWQEDFDRLELEGLNTVAERDGDSVLLTGPKTFIFGGAEADGYVVSARGNAGLELYWIAASAHGIEANPVLLNDGTFSVTLSFRDAAVPAANLLAFGEAARAILQQNLARATLLAAVELAAIARKSHAMTLEHLRTRQQFGRPIGAFQALQHRTVDAFIQIELAEAVVAEILQTGEGVSTAAYTADVSRAKARASEAALLATREAVQMHGAMGFTDESDVGLYLKRSFVLTAWMGGNRALRRRIAELVPVEQDSHEGEWSLPAHLLDAPTDTDWNALSDDDFRYLVRDFIERNYPGNLRFLARRVRWHEVRDWNTKLSARGWAAPAWPKAQGGMGLGPAKLLIFMDELERWGVGRAPDQGVRQVGPVLMRYGTEEQRQEYLPKILSWEHIWCQGYSEPNAGSDLASVTTRAVADGDDLIINGQKIWTSMAMDSTHIYVLCRTDPNAKKQLGISFIIVDLKTPGITIRPIRDIAGNNEFCEVFFDNVRVGRDKMVGELNNGWNVAKAVLDLERLGMGSPQRPTIAFNRLVGVARKLGLFEDPGFVEMFTRLRLELRDHTSLYASFAARVARGEAVGPEVSILKIWGMETFRRIAEFTIASAGEYGASADPVSIGDLETNIYGPYYMSRVATIGGGSNEIQRNIMARSVLDLPSK